MYRYMCIISYDGTNYMGFQIQNDLPTIELEIKNALKKMLNEDVKIYPSGRTDRYVHAKGQVIHFDLEKHISPISLKRGLNTYLKDDIHIINALEKDETFHARFSAKSKEYRYYINTAELDPITKNFSANIYNLDFDKMNEAIKLFEGTHDFKGFASAQIDKRKETIKTIYETKINVLGDYLEFIFIGNGFLKYQVRRMMGLLIEIGRGKETKEKILEIFDKKDPKISHKIAEGKGLFLYKVNY